MTDIKFGQQFQVTASPALVLMIDEKLEAWIAELATQDSIDVERECIGMAQSIVVAIANFKPSEVQ